MLKQKDAAETQCKGISGQFEASNIELERKNAEMQTELDKERVKVLELNYKYSARMEKAEEAEEGKGELMMARAFSIEPSSIRKMSEPPVKVGDLKARL